MTLICFPYILWQRDDTLSSKKGIRSSARALSRHRASLLYSPGVVNQCISKDLSCDALILFNGASSVHLHPTSDTNVHTVYLLPTSDSNVLERWHQCTHSAFASHFWHQCAHQCVRTLKYQVVSLRSRCVSKESTHIHSQIYKDQTCIENHTSSLL